MKTIEELKNAWEQNNEDKSFSTVYDQNLFEKIVKSRASKHTNESIKYFWPALTLQIIAYSLLVHFGVKNLVNSQIPWFSIGGIVLFIPYTYMLLKKFKKLAKTELQENSAISIHEYVSKQQLILQSFYKFKIRYDIFSVPASCALVVLLIYNYVPEGILKHLVSAFSLYIILLVGVFFVIRAENKKYFKLPIQNLKIILDEFNA
ncbi:MAG: hypothetical protein HOO86_01355 [Bacteroidales bacterium]|nr:hypothetical protein [Bacteroidales bacterium]